MNATESAGGFDVALLSVGARTSIGMSAPASAAAVRAAISGIGAHRHFVDSAGEKMYVAADNSLPGHVRGIDRFATLAATAMEEALEPLRGLSLREPLDVFIGLPEPRPGRPTRLDDELALRLDATTHALGLRTRTALMPNGNAAALMALEAAAKRLQNGTSDLCLVGGVDSYLEGETLEWLDAEGQLMSARNRSGFPPGEASGFCLLASSRGVHRFGLTAIGRVARAATAVEENRIKTETVCVGLGLSAAIATVTSGLRLPAERVATIYCDLNGERYRNEEYAFAALRNYPAFFSVHDTIHPADCWGDVGASSGALYACLAAAASQRGYAKGPRTVLWASSECGYRGAALLEFPAPVPRE